MLAQMRAVYRAVENIRFFDYPAKFIGVPSGSGTTNELVQPSLTESSLGRKVAVPGLARRAIVSKALFVSLIVLASGRVSAQPVMLVGGFESGQSSFGTSANLQLSAGRMNGWTAGVVAALSDQIAFVGRVSDIYGQPFSTPLAFNGRNRPSAFTFEGGIRLTLPASARVRPFVEGLVGPTNADVELNGIGVSAGPVVAVAQSWRAEGTAGAGIDLRLSRSFGVETEAIYSRGSMIDLAMSRFQMAAGFVWWVKN